MRKSLVLVALLLLPGAASAQRELTSRCAAGASAELREFCNLLAEGVEMAQPRFGIALTGGNPVPGASSTLGLRIGTIPRISVGARLTGAKVDLPPIERRLNNGDIDFLLVSANVDASVGLFSGFSLLPTVGGFGSIDLVASAGALFVPDKDGFRDDTPKSWAVGTRIGILRESFTAPGVAITGMYRRTGDVQFGDRQLQDTDAYFKADNLTTLSLRGTVGKKLLTLGGIAGVGYDRYSSDVAFGVTGPDLSGAPTRVDLDVDGFDNDRVTIFGGLTWTLLVLSATGELGWQSGGDDVTAALPANRSSQSGKSTWYGTLALRLSI